MVGASSIKSKNGPVYYSILFQTKQHTWIQTHKRFQTRTQQNIHVIFGVRIQLFTFFFLPLAISSSVRNLLVPRQSKFSVFSPFSHLYSFHTINLPHHFCHNSTKPTRLYETRLRNFIPLYMHFKRYNYALRSLV